MVQRKVGGNLPPFIEPMAFYTKEKSPFRVVGNINKIPIGSLENG